MVRTVSEMEGERVRRSGFRMGGGVAIRLKRANAVIKQVCAGSMHGSGWHILRKVCEEEGRQMGSGMR